MAQRGALVSPNSITSGGVAAFRAHIAKKNTYIQQTGKENTKRVRQDGFNPYGFLFYARKFGKNSKANDVLIMLGAFNHDDFEAAGLDKNIYRWNYQLGCVEILKRIHMDKGQKVDPRIIKEKGQLAFYPENQAEWEYVPAIPGTVITYSDFNFRINKERENTIVSIIDLMPKKKSKEQIEKYPEDPDYNWGVGGVNTNIYQFPEYAVASIMEKLPMSLFHLNNPNHVYQRYVMVRTIDLLVDEFLAKELARPVYAFMQLINSTDEDAWAFESKDDEKAKAAFIPPTSAGGKKRNTKCMKLFASISQKSDANSSAVSTISAQVIFWENAVEEAFCIRDIFLWFNCMRHLAYLISDAVLLSSVNLDRTSNSAWNAQSGGNEGDEGEIIALDADDSSALALGGGEAKGPDQASAPSIDNKVGVDEDFDALLAQDQASNALKAGDIKTEKIDFYLHLTVQKPSLDMFEFCRKHMFPVTEQYVFGEDSSVVGCLI